MKLSKKKFSSINSLNNVLFVDSIKCAYYYNSFYSWVDYIIAIRKYQFLEFILQEFCDWIITKQKKCQVNQKEQNAWSKIIDKTKAWQLKKKESIAYSIPFIWFL